MNFTVSFDLSEDYVCVLANKVVVVLWGDKAEYSSHCACVFGVNKANVNIVLD